MSELCESPIQRVGEQIFKCEFMQPSGSHKDRESLWIKENIKASEYCISTTGNAGISLAYWLGDKVRVFCPIGTHAEKIALMKSYGAQVVNKSDTYSDALNQCDNYVQTTAGRVNVSTGKCDKFLAYESLANQLLDYENVLVPSGTFTLACGIAAFHPGKVIACTLESDAPEKIADKFSSVNTNFRNQTLINSTHVSEIAVPNEALDILLAQRPKHSLLKNLDPVVCLPSYVQKKQNITHSIIIATGVDR